MTTETKPCPYCGRDLKRVEQPANSLLNTDQFDAVRLGDWYCPTCQSDKERHGHAYFWDRDVTRRSARDEAPFFPWNDLHPCFAGDFWSVDPFDHDFKYQDTSQGDEIYFQQSGHMECANCGHCESAEGWDSGLDDFAT